MKRYTQWLAFRLRAFMASWTGGFIFAFLFMGLVLANLGVQTLSSAAAMSAVLGWLRPPFQAIQTDTDHVSVSPTATAQDLSAPALKDPFSQPPEQDLRQALVDYNKMPDWLSRLENTPMIPRGVEVFISHPQHLTQRQLRLLRIQGFKLLPWTEPGKSDRLTAAPQYWVQWVDDPQSWIIHYRSLDVSSEDGPGGLVVLRSILWVHVLDELEKWEAQNPAPAPPPELHPSGVSTSLIPSSASNTLMATCGVWLLTLSLMSILAIVQMSWWGTAKASGAFVPLAGLGHDTHALLVTHSILVCLPVFALALLSSIAAWGGLTALGYDISFHWAWRTPVIVFMGLVLSHSLSILLQSLPSGREARQALGGLWVLILAGLNLWAASHWTSLRPLAAFLASNGVFLALAVSLLVSWVVLWLASLRLDAFSRRSYTAP